MSTTIRIGDGLYDGVNPCDYTGTINNFLAEDYPTSNWSTFGTLYLQNHTATRRHIIIAFTGISNIATNFVVSDVKLYLYCSAHVSTNSDLVARRIIQNWSMAQSTWNIYSTGNNWGTAGCLSDGTDRNATTSGTYTLTGVGTFYISGAQLITDVQDMITNGSNYGWVIQRATPAATEADDQFTPLDGATEHRPWIEITGDIPSGVTIDGVLCSKWNGVSVSGVL